MKCGVPPSPFRPDSQRAWSLVKIGLALKLAALLPFSLLPVLALCLWFWELPLAGPLAILATCAIVPDFVGRCLCLAEPVTPKLALRASVAFQAAGLISLAAFSWGADWVGVPIGLTLATCFQIGAAFFFVYHLRQLVIHLGAPALAVQADVLHTLMVQSLMAISGFSFMTTFVAALVLMVSLLTCGMGLVLAIPGAVALLPALLLTIVSVGAMYWIYGRTLLKILLAIDHHLQSAAAIRFALQEQSPFQDRR